MDGLFKKHNRGALYEWAQWVAYQRKSVHCF
ncbi:hypothetical protein BN1263180021 [Stenotrophomonas indicatrix]|nr:hypothetical protein BN1263180021 [Stenotrophomonas indicatrix]